MKRIPWVRIAELVNLPLGVDQISAMERYRDWLAAEALVSGGIGPNEAARIDQRHIGDSLLFATVMPEVPDEIWDLGSGVGLPGIPLAILLPETRFVLIERSGRRSDLLERIVRILDLGNVSVQNRDISDLKGQVRGLVTRATLGPEETAVVANRLLLEGGFAIAGGSWTKRPSHIGWETVEIPPDPLDHPVWLLIMRRQ